VQARFPKVEDRSRTAQLAWPDGFTATLPQHQYFARLPHDLEHYVVDAVLRPPYGFWELAAAKAPFKNLTPCRRWPRERTQWFARVVRDHRDEMVEAERLTGLLPTNTPSWEAARRMLASAWTDRPSNPRPDLTPESYERLMDLHEQLVSAWQSLPVGEWLSVTWPPPT
jgi:hypothetical protein